MHNNMVMLMRMPKQLWLQCVQETAPRFPIRPHPLPVCRLTMAQEHRQEQVRDAIKKAMPKPAPSRPLDPERTMGHDPRDPRADSQQWPCHGAHTPSKPQGNAHGAWVHCMVCNLRLQYVPKKGSTSGSTKVENPVMIQKMLQRLQPMMNGYRPNQTICAAMVKLIEAEEVLQTHINQEMDAQAFNSAFPSTKAKTKKSSPSTPSSSPAAQWDVVDNAYMPAEGYVDPNANNANPAEMS